MKCECAARVQVYYNLHKHCWSVRCKGCRRVVMHTDELYLDGVKFVVREGGRERVLREKRKNVHAFVEGWLVQPMYRTWADKEITYNPYRYSSFVDKATELPIRECEVVHMINRKVYEVRGW